MAESDAADKTEDPTPKRLEEARREGQVAQSRDLASVALLAGSWLAVVFFTGHSLGTGVAQQASAAWSGAQIHPHTLEDFHALVLQHGVAAARGFLPFALTLMLVAAGVGAGQTGFLWSTKALGIKLERLDPMNGLKRFVNLDRFYELGKAPLKLAVVGLATWLAVRANLGGILSTPAAPPVASLHLTYGIAVEVFVWAISGLAVLAAIDFAWSRLRHRRRLRMTLRDVRQEAREREGSPQVRRRRRQLQQDMSRQRMIADVSRADVVITNPTHYAVALRYAREEMSAPLVLARGRNHLAQRIRDAARRHGVPIVENPPLARVLYPATRVGKEIPDHLFQAVAEVLAYVYRLDRTRAAAWGAAP